ncbi:MAG: small multi-drug export protein [Armatimonadetes bacterium]|nr:small multi-drug export protein [Armatimonadota bacterium]
MNDWWIVLVSLVPWIELRGAIPLSIARGASPLQAFLLCSAVNALVTAPGWFALELFYERWFKRISWIEKRVERVRAAGRGHIERYKLLGLLIFVAVPLPGTGAYAGTLLAWLFGLPRERAWLAVAAGVFVAGMLVTAASVGLSHGFRWIVKH